MREHQKPRHLEAIARRRHGRALVWFLVAFAFLVGGVMAGAVWQTSKWAWVLPVGGFVAYVLAFRRALCVGRLESGGIDDIWRLSSSATGPGRLQRRGGWPLSSRGRRTGKVTRWDFRKGPSPGDRQFSDRIGSRRQG